jgi:hypothetical protein
MASSPVLCLLGAVLFDKGYTVTGLSATAVGVALCPVFCLTPYPQSPVVLRDLSSALPSAPAPPQTPEAVWLWDAAKDGYWHQGEFVSADQLRWLLRSWPAAPADTLPESDVQADLHAWKTWNQKEKNKDESTRVAPSVPCVAPTGTTAEQPTGAVTAAERTDPKALLARLDRLYGLSDVDPLLADLRVYFRQVLGLDFGAGR